MADLEYFLAKDDEHRPDKLTLVNYVSGSVLPVLGVAATIVFGWSGKHPIIVGSLIVVTVLSLMIGPLHWLLSTFRTKLNQARDEHAARLYLPLLRKQVERFGDFVNGKPDTLHYIAESCLCEGHGQKLARLGMPNAAAWSGRWELFNKRLDRQKASAYGLQLDVLEFHDLVGTYINLCVGVIFDRLPQDMSTQMSARAKSELGGFQQRFARFHAESEELLKEISRSRPCFARLPHNFTPVKPLS